MASSPIPVGETLANKYRIERIIGEGGMGVVVAAMHLELDQQVAIKFLLEGIADHQEGAERFRREARAAAKIHSDHVVRVLDVGVLPDGVRYMVMEYLEGRDLAEELADRGSLPFGVSCGMILEALDAVAQAHAVGIVHRDLKPANLFLAQRPDGSTRVKVLDFGISKSVGSATAEQLSLTKTSAWIGSPLYMAPEQMQSARDVDSRADVWSMGAILYEMICGRPPYEAESLPQLCNLLITTDPQPIQERVPTIPQDLAIAVMGCLVRDPAQRMQSASQFAQALARHATTATGSGVRISVLDATEFGAGMPSGAMSYEGGLSSTPSRASVHGAPASAMSSAPTQGVASGMPSQGQPLPSATPAGQVSMETSRGSTHAAWGGTDPALSESQQDRKGGAKWGILAALVLLAGIGGFFLMKAGAGEPPPELDSAVVAAQADQGLESEGATQGDSVKTSPVTASDDRVPKDESTDKAGDQSAADAKGEKQDEEKEETKARPAPAPKPRPIWRPRPRPQVVAPAPAPDPPPAAPAPAPTPRDSFSDFGGRR